MKLYELVGDAASDRAVQLVQAGCIDYAARSWRRDIAELGMFSRKKIHIIEEINWREDGTTYWIHVRIRCDTNQSQRKMQEE